MHNMYVAGIDVGSVATKVVIMGENYEVLGYGKTQTTVNIDETSGQFLTEVLVQSGLAREDLSYIVSTGYGRATVSFSDQHRTEIMCHALGVHNLFPSARTIVDIGGQDSKAIRIDNAGRVQNFAMNDKCAAGTGRFTEVMSNALGVELKRWGEVVGSAPSRARISSVCTVFAESEVISNMAQKTPLNVILAGVCESITARVYQLVQKLGAIEEDIAFTGGVANNLGVVRFLEEKLGAKLLIPEIPESAGALGAAYLARRYGRERGKVQVLQG